MRYFVLALTLLYLSALALAQGPTVFINGDTGVSGSSGGFALGGIGLGGGSVSKHDKTAEMARVLLKSCPEISITVSDSNSHPDYLMILSREESSFGDTTSQVMLLRPDKSVMFASKQSTVAKATKQGCKAIMADWTDKRAHTARTQPINLPAPATENWWKQQQAKSADGAKQ
jgi:hypothetical protein